MKNTFFGRGSSAYTGLLQKHEFLLYVSLFLIISFLTLPDPIIIPGSGLDPSWNIGINIASLENLQFGKDIIFTYGPLGFLHQPLLINYEMWALSLFFSLFVHFLFIGSIFYFVKNFSTRFIDYLVLSPILILATPTIVYKLVIIVSLITCIFLINSKSDREYYLCFSFMGLLLAADTFIKFTAFFISISIIVMVLFLLILMKKRVKYGMYFSLSYLIFLFLIWSISGQDISNLASYIYNGIALSTGYDAMAVNGSIYILIIGLGSILALIATFIYSIQEKNKNLIIYLMLNMGIFFLAFKHGFVRHDLHYLLFFNVYLIFSSLLSVIIYRGCGSQKLKYINFANISSIIVIFSLIAALGLLLPANPACNLVDYNIAGKVSSYKLAGEYLIGPPLFEAHLNNHKNKIREDFHLDQKTVEDIGDDTLDVFPWDISMAWAYGFNWAPRPVFQSYSVYTWQLDKINSMYFAAPAPPQKILYGYKSIDGRYPPFDEPEVFRKLLYNYSYSNTSEEYLLLINEPAISHNFSERKSLGSYTSALGSFIPVPEYPEGYVFGYMECEHNIIGKTMKLFYKSSPCYIQFKLKNNSYSQEFRFVPDTAKNGIFLSSYIDDLDSLAQVFQGSYTNDIEGIIIKTKGPVQMYKKINIEFVGIRQSPATKVTGM